MIPQVEMFSFVFFGSAGQVAFACAGVRVQLKAGIVFDLIKTKR